MPGPPPALNRQRARDNQTRDVLKSDGELRGPELDEEMRPVDKETGELEPWHPVVVRMWDELRRSPQASRMATDLDWHIAMLTADEIHIYLTSSRRSVERFKAIQSAYASFGATVADRLRLRMEVEVLEEYPVGNVDNSNVTSIDDRRMRIAGE